MAMEQLLLFPETREDKLEREMADLKKSCEKVRKGQFAKIGELTKMYYETKYELETLKEAICRTM